MNINEGTLHIPIRYQSSRFYLLHSRLYFIPVTALNQQFFLNDFGTIAVFS